MIESNAIVPNLPPSDWCCGCAACYSICPKHAIVMCPDAEGFLQPTVNHKVCIGCGKCENVCPVLNQGLPRTPLAVYAAKAKDDDLRRISSSGGVFSLLARQVLDKGGAVYGAAFEPPTHKVVHKRVTDESGLDELRGSKYVQSEIGETYIRVREDLENGIRVLFSGCPCQIAGVKAYLGKSYSNLLTVEVFCHAVPSPKIWQVFLEAQKRMTGDIIKKVESRRNCNWRAYEIAIEFNSRNGVRYIRKFPAWYAMFFKELCSRPCCYRCHARGFRSGADISIGDFWGIERAVPNMEDKLGVSICTINTHAGESAFNQIGMEVLTQRVTLAQASRVNKAIFSNEKVSKHRNRFMVEVTEENFNSVVPAFTDPPKWFVFLRNIKRKLLGVPSE